MFWILAISTITLFSGWVLAQDDQYQEGVQAYVEGDYERAVKIWLIEAYEGSVEAQFNLGVMYIEGKGVAQSRDNAIFWLSKAASIGHAESQYNLGHLYLEEKQDPTKVQQGVHWWHEAAKNGFAIAQYNYGRALYYGIGVDKDRQTSRIWLEQAAAAGDQSSLQFLEVNAGTFGPEDSTGAARETVAVVPEPPSEEQETVAGLIEPPSEEQETVAGLIEPPSMEQETVAGLIEPPPMEQETVAGLIEPPSVEQETAAVVPEPPSVEQETVAGLIEPPPMEQETVAVVPEPQSVEQETVAGLIEPPPMEQETVAGLIEPPPMEQETVAGLTEPPSVEQETVAGVSEPPSEEQETVAGLIEPPSVEQETDAGLIEPLSVEQETAASPASQFDKASLNLNSNRLPGSVDETPIPKPFSATGSDEVLQQKLSMLDSVTQGRDAVVAQGPVIVEPTSAAATVGDPPLFVLTQNEPALIYSRSHPRAPVIDSVMVRTLLRVVSAYGNWLQVQVPGGFPGWIKGDQLATANHLSEVVVDSAPIYTDPADRFSDNDIGELARGTKMLTLGEQGDWVRVQVPEYLPGWIEAGSVRKVVAPAEQIAEVWQAQGLKQKIEAMHYRKQSLLSASKQLVLADNSESLPTSFPAAQPLEQKVTISPDFQKQPLVQDAQEAGKTILDQSLFVDEFVVLNSQDKITSNISGPEKEAQRQSTPPGDTDDQQLVVLPSRQGVAKPATFPGVPLEEQTVRDWASAWSRQDITRYLGYYAPSFRPNEPGLSRSAWEAQRRERLSRPGKIEITLSDLFVVQRSEDSSEVKFIQKYESDLYRDQIVKSLELRKVRQNWQIVAERTLKTLPQ